jgi:ribose-phosphate pyrophosphokinase
MRAYASRVTEYLVKYPDFAPLAETINGIDILHTDRFADGEIEVSVHRSVRDIDVILFANCAQNEANLSVEEAKIELYHAVDALKRSMARNIIIFEPFISCSRSDRTTRRNSVGLWIHFKTLTGLGAAHIITYQLHSKISQSMLDPAVCNMDDISGLTLLQRYLCDNYIRDLDFLEKNVRPYWAFCSVDTGGENQVRDFANAFGASLIVGHKQRDYTKPNTLKSFNVLSAAPVAGKTLWIVDDLVDTAGSVESLIRALAPHNPAEINILAVHGTLSPPAPERLMKLANEGLLKRLVVTDTINLNSLKAQIPFLEVVSSTELSARLIHTLLSHKSMGALMELFNAEAYLKNSGLFA